MRQIIGFLAMASLILLAVLVVVTSLVLMIVRGDIWAAVAVGVVLGIAALGVWGCLPEVMTVPDARTMMTTWACPCGETVPIAIEGTMGSNETGLTLTVSVSDSTLADAFAHAWTHCTESSD